MLPKRPTSSPLLSTKQSKENRLRNDNAKRNNGRMFRVYLTLVCLVSLIAPFLLRTNNNSHVKSGNNQRWKKVWEARGVQASRDEGGGGESSLKSLSPTLEDLLNADGFDSSSTKLHLSVASTLSPNVFPGNSVAEVASGAGAALFRVADAVRNVPNVRFVGMDYSLPLLAIGTRYARSLPPSHPGRTAVFVEADASASTHIPSESFDVVYLNSILQYMDDEAHVVRVVSEMIRMTARPGKVFLFDVQDLDRRNDCEEARARANYALKQDKVSKPGTSLERLFVSKQVLRAVGEQHGCTVKIENSGLTEKEYVNAPCSYWVMYQCH